MAWYQNIIRKNSNDPPPPSKDKKPKKEDAEKSKGPLSFLNKEWEDPAFVKSMRGMLGSGTAEAPAKTKATSAAPEIPKELADSPEAKGAMSFFYRKWKDPTFLKQMKVLAAHMDKDGVNIKDQAAVKAWVEKNKTGIEAGKFNEAPAGAAKVETFVKSSPDISRNAPCPCGSGKKYKKCCANK